MSDFQYFLKGAWATVKSALAIPLMLYGIVSSPIGAPIVAFSGPSHDFDLLAALIVAPGALLWVICFIALTVDGFINKGKEVEKEALAKVTAPGSKGAVNLEDENLALKRRIKQLEGELADNALLGKK